VNQTAQEAFVFTRRDATAEPVRDYLPVGVIRRSEWVILGFLVYAVALGVLLPVGPSVRHSATLLNGAILAAYTMLIVADRTKPAVAFGAARDAALLTLIVLAYREIGWFGHPRLDHTLETSCEAVRQQ
jgi:hypothetical protein